jgi:glycosyltransferase involved in cell wall biosynthesis
MDAAATIYYICFVPPKTGGELVNLQAVATLNQLGVRAAALVNPEAKLDGLPKDFGVPIERLAPGRAFRPDDIVVIPEYYRDAFRHFATLPCRRVVHTQGPFLTFRGFDSIEAMNAAGLHAGISCSTFGMQLMQRMGSTLPWHVVTPFVHPLFHDNGTPKKLQVAYMPDKRPKEAPVVLSLFRQLHPQFAHVPWVPIANMSRADCAKAMAQSAVFASFSYLEGLGLPPLEAMASGCLVCGFDGHGGSDFAQPENGLWVKEGDHEGFAHAVAAALTLAREGNDATRQQLTAGQRTAALYSIPRFERELLAAWKTIIGEQWSHYLLDTKQGSPGH